MFYYHDMFGTFRPQCHPDGEYDRLQCYNSLCYCVDEHGKKIKGTETEAGGVPPCGGKHLEEGRGGAGWVGEGEYDRLQCYNSLCYCVDEHGKKIKGTETEAGGVPPCGGKHLEEGRGGVGR